MRTWLLTLLAVLMMPLFAADTAATNAEDEDFVELRLRVIPYSGTSSPDWMSRRKAFDEFVRLNPKIHIKALVPLRIEGTASDESEFLAMAGGVAPDVLYLTERKAADYRTQGFLLSLNSYLKEFEKSKRMRYKGIYSPSSAWELCHSSGHIYMVPYYYAPMTILCHTPTFARNGLAGKSPKDWDEMYDFSRKMTFDPAKEPNAPPGTPLTYGISMNHASGSSGWNYVQFVLSAGGNVVTPYIEKNGKLVEVPPPPVDYRRLGIDVSDDAKFYSMIASNRKYMEGLGMPAEYAMEDVKWRLETEKPKAMRALHFYRKMIQQPWMRNKGREFDVTVEMIRARKAVDPFSGDTFDLTKKEIIDRIYIGVVDSAAAMVGRNVKEKYFGMKAVFLSEAGTASDLNTDPTEWTLATFPSYPGENYAFMLGGHYIGINSTIASEDVPGRRDKAKIMKAAWDYIEYMTGPEAQAIKARMYIDLGVQEYVRPSILRMAGFEDVVERIPRERVKFWDHVENNAKMIHYCKGFTHVLTGDLKIPIDAVGNDPIDLVTGNFKKDPQAVMEEVVKRVNDTIIGDLPPHEIKRRSNLGWIILAVIFAGIIAGGVMIIRAGIKMEAKFRDSEGFGVGGHPGRRRIYAWLFLLPAVATILIWAYYPLARGLMMAFQDYKILGSSKYVGLKNFIEIVGDITFWRYLLQTFIYVGYSIGLGFLVPLGLAILLSEIPKGKVFFRTLYYLPSLTTGIVTLFLWKGMLYDNTKQGLLNSFMLMFNDWPLAAALTVKLLLFAGFGLLAVMCIIQIFNRRNEKMERFFAIAIGGLIGGFLIFLLANSVLREGPVGLVRMFASAFNFKVQKFLQDPDLAMLWIIVPAVWAHAGSGCLIYLAALKGIPDGQYEAADIDGAGFWKKIVHVTFPNLKALIIINFVGSVVGAFHASQNIFVMTGGGPEDKTMTAGLFIWYNAFVYLDYGTATAAAWILGALLIGFTLNQLRIMNKMQFRSTSVEEKAGGGSRT